MCNGTGWRVQSPLFIVKNPPHTERTSTCPELVILPGQGMAFWSRAVFKKGITHLSIFVRSYCDIQTHREVEGEKHRDGDRGCSPGRRRGIGVAASAEGQQINRPHVAQVCSRSQNRNVTINLESNGHAPPRQAPFLQMLVMELLILIFYFFFPPHPIIKIYTYLRCKIMDRSCLDSRSRHK